MANRAPERKTQILLSSPWDGVADYFPNGDFLILHKRMQQKVLHCVSAVEYMWSSAISRQVIHSYPHSLRHVERVRHVLHEDPLSRQKDAHHVELVRLAVAPVAVDPDPRRARELALLSVMYRFHRIAELVALARFHFDEGDGTRPFRHEVDVSPSVAEPAVQDPPALTNEPAFGDALTQVTEALVVLSHAAKLEPFAEPA